MKFYAVTLLMALSVLMSCVVGGVAGQSVAEVPPPAVRENDEVQRTYLGVNVYKTEWPCARQGGLCVHRADCQSPTTKSGLCPESANRGVECCYEVRPAKDLQCRQYPGQCVVWCQPALQMPAKDCETGSMCCVISLH
uniref:Putative conserved secreted protein n=1 Tax=Culex tarsalis TaxID=7177 RepID=A0A1Q3EUI8_CULTA